MVAQRGQWPAVLEAYCQRRPEDGDWLEHPPWCAWVDLDRHVGLVDAAAEVMGLDAVRALGQERLADELHSGLLATVVRSWLRTFAGTPNQLLRVAPYLWRAGFRGCGDMILEDTQDTVLRFRVAQAPPQLRASMAWQTLLIGFGEGFLSLAQVQGEIRLFDLDDAPGDMGVSVSWAPASP
jgi:hypothetical protein